MKFKKIKYKFDALEPHIDEKTIRIHYTRHHKAYVEKLNKALEPYPGLQKKTVREILQKPNKIPKKIRTKVLQNGGQAVNHDLYFSILKKDVDISGQIKKAIPQEFGSFKKFKKNFIDSALSLFGSGWVFLSLGKSGLEIEAKKNHETPLMQGNMPIMALDVWEHAYYLKYKNKRAEYVENFFEIIDWDSVNKLYKRAKKYF